MPAGRTALAELVHHLLHHPPPQSAAPRPLQQINVHVRGIHVVRLRSEVVGVMIPGMDGLCPGPSGRIALWHRELGAEFRSPLGLVTGVKLLRIQRAEGVAADALIILQDQAQFRLEGEIRADKDPAQRIRVVAIEWLAILAVVAGLETNVIRAGLDHQRGRRES